MFDSSRYYFLIASNAQICIGGFCFPIYALVPIALIVLQSLWEWVRVNVLGQNDDALFENVRPLCLSLSACALPRSRRLATHCFMLVWAEMQSRVVHVTSPEQYRELQLKSKNTKRSVRGQHVLLL